jgi:hypothetical protein
MRIKIKKKINFLRVKLKRKINLAKGQKNQKNEDQNWHKN